ncbi:Nedd8-activating enzyme E1 regulatory subunit [Lucilia cuprina]|uniref:NEDD8-activating enzyme E1 regulatory subunit n=1 Tax=Lucilia cuprina TaxID=7375 RepID=A0A0L0CM47_LUCCU|nr:Nedd8-activating enzyme E1 regulatory subunit [Lucilia cuprina]KNC33346.1 Nedd8-activating enzyme E1 regulatory subunit [Lucilia cuprina]
MSSPAPKSPEQSDKNKKYDRQIRLWGEHGQSLLESAKICLVNATGLGCEVLKGLVLPGIGSFTIVDGNVVTEEDLGINFFVEASNVGQSRAASCMQLLQELNSDVNGDCVDESVDYILANRPAFFDNFDVVIASNLNENSLLQLSNCLWEANVPLVYCRSLGFFGSIRLQIKEHCVVESHPDNAQYDLRLEQPFDTLRKHLEATTITNKVPWLLVLNKYYKQWQLENNGKNPSNYKEKSQIREMIRKDMSNDEENYEEAIKAVNTAFTGGSIPSNLKSIFEDEACRNLNKQSKPFWIMAKALKEFIEKDNNGILPLSGVLPDMTSDTESYINLQNIYRQQAMQDADNVYRKCQAILKELGLPLDCITEKTVRLFCKESSGLTVIRGSKISDEYEKNNRVLSVIDDIDVQGTLTEHYIALRAYERFLTECGNIPGDCYVENDTARFKSVACKMLAEWGVTQATLSDDMVHEVCHYGGGEVHTISAFIAGCAAQEVVKILTNQFKPVDNTFIYNGITSETITLKL